MKHIAIVISLLFLTGCPAQSRIYLHNDSKSMIIIPESLTGSETLELKPGKTKWITNVQAINDCFEFKVDNQSHSYILDRAKFSESWKQKRYGERFDLFYRNNRLYIKNIAGELLEFAETDNCENT